MRDNSMVILSDRFENEKTGEMVEGITIMVDGKFKAMLDIIIEKEGVHKNYAEAIRDIVFSGVNSYVEKYNGG